MSPARRYGFGFWAVAAVFLTVIAFSTAPGPLYTLYRERDGFSALAVTIIYAAYAVGAVVGLVRAGHLSDSHGRRRVLVPALLLEIVAPVFLFWPALPGLIVARSPTGLGIGPHVRRGTDHRPGPAAWPAISARERPHPARQSCWCSPHRSKKSQHSRWPQQFTTAATGNSDTRGFVRAGYADR